MAGICKNNQVRLGTERSPSRPGHLCVLVTLVLLIGCFWRLPIQAADASVSVAIDPPFITLGETATLSITFSGSAQHPAPTLPEILNLHIIHQGRQQSMTMAGGQTSISVTHQYGVSATAPGDYVIPALKFDLGGQTITTRPLQFKVLKPEAPTQQAIDAGNQIAFLKIVLPKQQLYVGEVIAAELQIHVRAEIQGLEDFQMTGFPAEGLLLGKMVQGRQRQVRLGNFTFNIIPLSFTLRPLRTGDFTLGPPTASLVVQLPSRRRDPFEFFNFGERKRITLAGEAQKIEARALPAENVPPSFNGAVGKYTMNVTAGPTNVAVGDPITLRVQINGAGALEALTLPDQNWNDFKLYPATSQLETTDPLGLQGTKIFEQVVAPETVEVKALPSFAFSFFDPESKAYRVLTQPPLPLSIRPAGALPLPSVVATNLAKTDAENPTREIVHIKPRPGVFAQVQPPLLQQPWYIGMQLLPVLAWLAALIWRKRSEALARNPRLVRSRRLTQTLRDGGQQLRQSSSSNQPEVFFATLFRLLQELLGERLDLPASAITEAVIEEQLRPRGVPASTLDLLHQLFQACNVARYAPVQTTQEMTVLIGTFETVSAELRRLRL